MVTKNFILSLFLLTSLIAGEFQSSFPEYTRTWVGPDYWSNRLQDWRVTMGRLECLNGEAGKPMRTTHWLSGEISQESGPFTIEMRTGSLGYYNSADGSSWSGILIGAGEGQLDYRSAALIHHLPGIGGGILAVFDDQGNAKFLSNRSENQTTRDVIGERSENAPVDRTGALGNHEDYLLVLTASREQGERRNLDLVVTDIHTKRVVARASLPNVEASRIRGGVAMVSHGGESAERRYWFRDFKASGQSITTHPDRRYGPVLGAIYSKSAGTLKLNAQFPPLGFSDAAEATLEFKNSNERNWEPVAIANIEPPSYTALFRVEDFSYDDSTEYRIRYHYDGRDSFFHGEIPADPQNDDTIRIVGLTCYQNIGKSADAGWGEGFYGTPEGRWTPENLWFPHNELVEAIHQHQPHLIALLGDQIYEGGNPTNSDHREGNPHLDYLYKWYITLCEVA